MEGEWKTKNLTNGPKKRAEAILGFYIHLSVYILVCILLVIINLVTSPEYKWFWWPIIGWGIGVFSHWLGIFLSTSGLVERMTQKELERERMRKG